MSETTRYVKPATDLTASIVLLDAVQDVLFRLLHRAGAAGASRKDFLGRELVATPYGGHYGRVAGWVLCVNGSPPRGTVVFATPCEHQEALLYYHPHGKVRRLGNTTEAAQTLWRFWESELKGKEEPLWFRLTEEP